MKMKTGRRKVTSLKSKDFLTDFIHYYKLLPALWNVKCQGYHNRDTRQKCYLLLLQKYRENEPMATLRNVKLKINSLRSNYRRHLRRLEKGEPAPNLPWWKEMHFITGKEEVDHEIDVEASYSLLKEDPSFDEQAELTDVQYLEDTENDTTYNELHNDTTYNEQENDTKYDEQEDDSRYNELESDTNYDEHENETTPKQVYKIVKKEKPEPRLIYKNETQDEEMSNDNTEDEYYCWGKVMIAELKKMSPIQQIYAKRAITEVLMEGQLGLLNKDSVQINNTHSDQINKSSDDQQMNTSDGDTE